MNIYRLCKDGRLVPCFLESAPGVLQPRVNTGAVKIVDMNGTSCRDINL
jgi:hypothetical protein